jgi:rhodanese-related sulfurtransferase
MSFDTIRTNDIIKYIGERNVIIIDLRDRNEYETGHIPTAINIPYEELEERKSSLNRNNLLIFYCDRGNISLLAARDLIKYGYNIKSLYGGIRAYNGRLDHSLG